MRRTIVVAISTAITLATLSEAQAAVQTVEADNGAVYEILYTARNADHAEAHILTPDNEEIRFIFDCHGRMIVGSDFNSSNIRSIPPRSVAGRIAQIACGMPNK
jgi:hypothetical protein